MDSKRTEKEVEFDLLMKSRPNIYGNRFSVIVLKSILRLASLFFLVCGIILTLSSIWESTKNDVFGVGFKVQKNNKEMLAACCFLIWTALTVAVWFGRMLLKRNAFLIALDIWHQNQIKKSENAKGEK